MEQQLEIFSFIVHSNFKKRKMIKLWEVNADKL